MKRLNKKLITLLLSGACMASLGFATIATAGADEPTASLAKTYDITSVFGASSGSLSAEKLNEGDAKETVAFTLQDGQYARIKRDVAFKWFEGAGSAKYFNMQFAFKEINFDSVTFTVESATSVANDEDKAVNAVEFKNKDGAVYVTVINGGERGAEQATTIAAGQTVSLAFSQTAGATAFDEFELLLNGTDIGEFKGIGASFGDYSLDKIHPLEITAKMPEAAEGEDKPSTVVFMQSLNGQRFDNVENSKIADTAAPVLVVNEDVGGFQFGTAFSLSYEVVDVLQTSDLKKTMSYYQYNPADDKVTYNDTLSTSTYFMDSVYYYNGSAEKKFSKDEADLKNGYVEKSVLTVEDREYVSIKFTLGDDTFKDAEGTYAKQAFELAWYAQDNAIVTPSANCFGETADDVKYIVIDQNTDGATYKYITIDEANAKNVYSVNGEVGDAASQEAAELALKGDGTSANKGEVGKYEERLAKEAKDVYAGSNSSITLPDVEWLIADNGGYRGLRFTISYKTPTATSPKTASSLSYNSLKLSTTEEGLYEFKIFANDKAGNTMKYYLDGKLVDVSTDNIWDIEEIPSFTFEIANLGIKVEEGKTSDKKAEKILDQTYTLSGLKVVGATNQESKYALYRLDTSNYQGKPITEAALTGVKFEEVRSAAMNRASEVGTEEYPTYIDLYVNIYAEKVAEIIGGNAEEIEKCFKVIKEYNANITTSDPEWEEYNKYQWNTSSKSFKTVEEGRYLIVADFWEKDLKAQRAMGYKLVVVESKADIIEGDSKFDEWIENNVASVVLFSIAGVMLIAIIILLLVKPTDETLEDVDAKAKKKKDKKKKSKKDE